VGTEIKSAVVGYHGTFWADEETLDLVRLEAEADDVPADVGVAVNRDVMEYGRVRIGESDFLLPVASELVMTDSQGNESRNTAQFAGCRQYAGASVIRFDDAPASAETAAVPQVVRLPAGLLVEALLTSAIDPATAAIGDMISATIQSTIRKGQEVLVPKGAILRGHITRLERRKAGFGDYYVVGLAFSELEAGARRGSFTGNLEGTVQTGNRYWVPFASDPGRPPSIWSSVREPVAEPRPGEGVVLAKEHGLILPAGFWMRWRTL
jgi:hypothetical protein